MSIEGIVSEHFSAPTHTETEGKPQSRTRNDVFHSFFSDNSEQDYATTTAHRKHIIELLNQQNSMSNTLSTIWENTDGFDEHYRCATALYLMAMLSQAFSVILDCGISEPVHGIEVVDGLNAIGKRFLFRLILTVQFPGDQFYDTQMVMHTVTSTSDVSLAS